MTDDTSILNNIGKIRLEDWKIRGDYYLDRYIDKKEYKFQPIKWQIQNEQDDFKEFCNTINEQQSALISGGAGCGKTEVIKSIRTKTDLILCFTNKATENIISRCGDDKNIYTFDTFFNEHLNHEQKLNKISEYDRIIIDEYSMTPVHMMNLLNQIKEKLNTKLLFFGDNNQCLAVETNNIIYDYINTDTFNKMCNGNQFICSYKEQYSRYDIKLKTLLDEFLLAGKIPQKLEQSNNTQTFNNICRSLKMKWQINNECSKRFINSNPTNKTKKLKLKKVISKKTTEFEFKFAIDMPLMCVENLKALKLYNGTICKIDDITDSHIIIGENKFDFDKFIKCFEPGFVKLCTNIKDPLLKKITIYMS